MDDRKKWGSPPPGAHESANQKKSYVRSDSPERSRDKNSLEKENTVREKKDAQKTYNRPQKYSTRTKDRHSEKKAIFISVVAPLYNEEESIPELALQLEAELKKIVNNRYEVIFIDDGSIDNSYAVIRRLHARNPKFRAIRFRRNYGKAAALSAGFAEARGDYVVTIDSDLQDDPAEISNLINKLEEGYDLVSGWKKKRKDSFIKNITSRVYNFATSFTSGVKLHDHNCGLKAYRKEVVKSIQLYGEMHRYIPALANWDGFRVAETPVLHRARLYGKSKYGLTRFVKGFLDLLTVLFTTRFIKRPLHFFGTLGALFSLSGLVIDTWLTIEWALGRTALSNRPLALMGIALIIVGVQFISMGLIGELIAKNALQNQNYKVKETLK